MVMRERLSIYPLVNLLNSIKSQHTCEMKLATWLMSLALFLLCAWLTRSADVGGSLNPCIGGCDCSNRIVLKCRSISVTRQMNNYLQRKLALAFRHYDFKDAKGT